MRTYHRRDADKPYYLNPGRCNQRMLDPQASAIFTLTHLTSHRVVWHWNALHQCMVDVSAIN